MIIETARLTLRPYTIEDFEPYSAMMAAAAAGQRQPWSLSMSREECWNRVLRCIGHWQVFGFGIFVVEEKESGRFVGETGLAHFERGIGAGFDGVAEATWSVTGDARGRGYAREAAERALRWYEERHRDARTVCLVHPENAPSLRIAQGLGYREFGRCTYKDQPMFMLESAAAPGVGRP